MRDQELNKSIGINLRRARLSRGMSQVDVGNILGVTFQQLQKYEKGHNRISAAKLVTFCKHLGCPYESILPALDATHDVDLFARRHKQVKELLAKAIKILSD